MTATFRPSWPIARSNGFLVSFKNLSCVVPRGKKQDPLVVLDNVSGYLRPGEAGAGGAGHGIHG